MAKRHSSETILIRWTIDEQRWREFMVEKHPPYRITFKPPKDFPSSGIEVVIRDDAIFVDNTFIRGYIPDRGYYGLSVCDSRLVFHLDSSLSYMVPIASAARADVTHLIERFSA